MQHADYTPQKCRRLRESIFQNSPNSKPVDNITRAERIWEQYVASWGGDREVSAELLRRHREARGL